MKVNGRQARRKASLQTQEVQNRVYSTVVTRSPMSKYLNKLREFEFTDILGWSYSRYSTFQQCHRRYFYEYYGKRDIENVQKITHLRRLTTVPLEIGNISHHVIRALLVRLRKTAREIDLEKFLDYARRETFRICQEKEFEDVYYRKRDGIDVETEILQPVYRAMENFLKSGRLQWIFQEAMASKDDWIIELGEKFKFGECRIENMKAYCKVDFMFPVGDTLHIIEWKTGKPDHAKHNMQLRGYAGWANFHFKVDYSDIRPTVAYLLPEYDELEVELNDYDLDDFAERVRAETDRMYEFCEVPELNFPLPKERFKMTELTNLCAYCKYRELCGRE